VLIRLKIAGFPLSAGENYPTSPDKHVCQPLMRGRTQLRQYDVAILGRRSMVGTTYRSGTRFGPSGHSQDSGAVWII